MIDDKSFYERVIILNCGGTIDMNQKRSVTSQSVLSVMPQIKNLLQPLGIYFEYKDVFEYPLDSTNNGQEKSVIEQRQIVLKTAYEKCPERFVKKFPTPPEVPAAVWINPPEKSLKGG